MTLDDFRSQTLPEFERYLDTCLSDTFSDNRTRLTDAMRYSSLDAGKRFRPLLVLASQTCFDTNIEPMLPVAAAIECIHCFSLIHDDLPAMDDDDLRRGKPSCHKAFDDATAILAGDALHARAFEIIASKLPAFFPAHDCLHVSNMLARAVGGHGLIGGQLLDMFPAKNRSLADLKTLHQHKTGALIEASITIPAHLNQADPDVINALSSFGRHLGLCFQIRDDILDVTSTSTDLAKTHGKDEIQNKFTFVQLLGLDGAKQALKTEHQHGLDALRACSDSDTALLSDLLAWLMASM